MPFPVIEIISPGSTSLITVPPTAVMAALSEASIYVTDLPFSPDTAPSPDVLSSPAPEIFSTLCPSIIGFMPNGSRMPTSFLGLMTITA